MVDHPEATATVLKGSRPQPPGQRPLDQTRIFDLDDQRIILAPGPQHTVPTPVLDAIRRQLSHRCHEIEGTIGG